MSGIRGTRAAALRLAKRLMPADGELDGFLENLGRHRGRPVQVLSRRFQARVTSGLWLPAAQVDYLVVDQPTAPSRRAAIICHEAAHMLLGHQPDAATSDAIAAAAPDLSPALIARALARHGYATDEEADAEQLGTLIGAEHSRLQINASRLR